MPTNLKLFLMVFLVPLVLLIVGAACGWSTFLIMVIVFATGGVGYFFFNLTQKKKRQKHKNDMYVEGSENKMTITARNSYVIDLITIEAEMNVSLGYNPAEITYSSMTLGGVTTGKLDFKDESTSINGYKNGKYYLKYGYQETSWPIYYIKLSDKLVEEAKKNSFISEYLVGNTLILRDTGRKYSKKEVDAFNYHMNNGSLESITKATKILGGGPPRSLLSYDDCVRIRRWLGGR